MKVMLINSPWILEKKHKDFFRITQPDGLGYIAAMLRLHHHQVKFLDAAATGWHQQMEVGDKIHFGMRYDQILSVIKKFKPDLVGVSIISSLLKQNGYSLCEYIKRNYPCQIVVGGGHPSVAPEDCLSRPYIDYVVIGEGEYTLLDLAAELTKKRPRLASVKSLVYKDKKNHIIKNPRRDAILDLDSLPLPARDLYPMSDYYAASKKLLSSFCLSTFNKKWATIISSRGCPYNCIFCSIHLSMGRLWRSRSATHVVSEIELLVKKYNVEHIAFLDDNMTLNQARINDICDQILSKNLKFTWSTPNGLRADTLDGPLLKKMKKAGCVRIAVAPESGSQKVVNHIIGKNLNLKFVERAVTLSRKVGIQIDCFFVAGLPGETKRNLTQTLNFAKKLRKMGASGFNFAIATPFLGTRLHQEFAILGVLPKDFDEFTMFRNQSLIATDKLSVADLVEFKKTAHKLNQFPIEYAKFIFLMLIRDPIRFWSLAKNQIPALSFVKK